MLRGLVRQPARLAQSIRFASNKVPAATIGEHAVGSAAEPSTTPAEILSGAPEELSTRRVCRIYQETKSATQSGTWRTQPWKIDFDVDGHNHRWENDMIGWQSTADVVQALELKFKTEEQAINFAESQGWTYSITPKEPQIYRKKEYANNFLHSKGPLKHIRTK
ncbi:hypothetical protein CANCADRAFT_3970 [Tortispora caseinolytica NRRL Y-17796]|uniref:NADH dehydrogenase [ubiquinone] iron-sulfur protein 4, mitochondrial n=1 Tax=Tortispora caseinolytica NRRL Y-17796 TaxID=767744 RepID=A0A1E4TC60_9ASCO|nr:hypothetical protein CANCADRAFT_3970 [Tortispora caseinolytica NRRL Y-17796]